LLERVLSKLAAMLYPVRDAYVARFEAFLRDLPSKTRSFVVEPELRNSDGSPSRRGALGVITRMDVMGRTPYGSVKAFAVDSDRRVEFPRVRLDEDGLDVGLAPFVWESMELWTDGPEEKISRALAAWFQTAAAPLASFSLKATRKVSQVA
jgi:hypothetical protein